MRRLTWLNWLELLFVVLPATLMVAMLTFFLLLVAFIGVALTPVFTLLASQEDTGGEMIGASIGASAGSVIFFLGLGAVAVIGLVALILLGLAIIAGPEWIVQRPALRWLIVIFGVLGLVEAMWQLIWYLDSVPRDLVGVSPESWIWLSLWIYLLVAPVLVGAKYIYLLFR